MLDLQVLAALAELRQQAEMDAILGKLVSLGYRAALRSGREALADSAGLPYDDVADIDLFSERRLGRRAGTSPIGGDVLFQDDRAFLIFSMGPKLFVAEIRPIELPSRISEFAEEVRQAAADSLDGRRLRGMSFDWSQADLPAALRRQTGPTPGAVTQQPASYTHAELTQSMAAVNSQDRAFLLNVAQMAKTPAPGEDDAEAPSAVHLLEAGLVRREYLLTCRKDSHTLCTVADLERLAGVEAADLACAVCGRPFRDELSQEILSLTPEGRALTTGSRWMTIWVTHALTQCGVPIEAISWSVASGEDEIDIAVTLLDRRVFFELKDREFGVGDAYPFVTRITRYGGEFGVVVTTDQVGEEAKKYLEEQIQTPGGSGVFTIEGSDDLAVSLDVVTKFVSGVFILERIRGLSDRGTLNVLPLLTPWLDARTR